MKNEQYLVMAALVLSLVFAIIIPAGLGAIATIMLAVVGIVIGFTTITKKESQEFLIVSLVLGTLTAALWAIFPVGTEMFSSFLRAFFGNLATVIIPAAVLVGVARWYDIAKHK